MISIRSLSRIVLGITFLLAFSLANATDYRTFSLKWYAGPDISATGLMTFDIDRIVNGTVPFSAFSNFSITISGASQGNGTFTKSDYSNILFSWPSMYSLDFSKQLVGQSLFTDPAAVALNSYFLIEGSGQYGQTGMFLPISNHSRWYAPEQYGESTSIILGINWDKGESGPALLITSISPAPEPCVIFLLLAGLTVIYFGHKRRKAN